VVGRYEGMGGINKIAGALQIGAPTVLAILVRHGVERRRPGTPRRVHLDDVVALYKEASFEPRSPRSSGARR
jgi:hypothetical protein